MRAISASRDISVTGSQIMENSAQASSGRALGGGASLESVAGSLSLGSSSFGHNPALSSSGTASGGAVLLSRGSGPSRSRGMPFIRMRAEEFKALTALGPAIIRVGLRNSDDVGARLDLKTEVSLGEVMIGDGELDNVTDGNSGFGNAVLKSIALQLPAPVDASLGPSLSMRLSVRITCTGRGHASGTPRLWFNRLARERCPPAL